MAPDAPSTRMFSAVVVGAGPGGICAVGALLERGIGPICWVDKVFDAGKLSEAYRDVPSNTRNDITIAFAQSLSAFRKALSYGDGDNGLQDLDPTDFCDLEHTAELLSKLSRGLRRFSSVVSIYGWVEAVELREADPGRWSVKIRQGEDAYVSVSTERVVLCTGSSPQTLPLPRHKSLPVDKALAMSLDLDIVVSRNKLADFLNTLQPESTIAVLGSSHSAVLALKNLAELRQRTSKGLKIIWLTYRELIHAEWHDGAYLRDNIGLKGVASNWARDNLETPLDRDRNAIIKVLYRIEDEAEMLAVASYDSDWIVQCIGFRANPVPLVLRTGAAISRPPQICFDHDTGCFHLVNMNHEYKHGAVGMRLPGLHGLGIPFSQRVYRADDNQWTYNVGYGGFVKSAMAWGKNWKIGFPPEGEEKEDKDIIMCGSRFTVIEVLDSTV